jgi:hypothetical protein
MSGSDDSTAAACRYVLVALLQRLDAQHAGLVDDLLTGIEADRAAATQGGSLATPVEATFSAAVRILQLAKGN